MLYQLHWQHRTEHHRTIFVAQTEANNRDEAEDVLKHFGEVIDRRKDECPEGWCALVCDETYERFELAAK